MNAPRHERDAGSNEALLRDMLRRAEIAAA